MTPAIAKWLRYQARKELKAARMERYADKCHLNNQTVHELRDPKIWKGATATAKKQLNRTMRKIRLLKAVIIDLSKPTK